ncbi:MAG TPA: VOC family protein [Candidatus Tumulicola sp.]|jgi:catechol 2,3-dioxygenase-like lactoylglutathione lyase family enzyme
MLHHLDVHVRDLGEAIRFFDVLAEHVGYRRLPVDPNEPDHAGYETADGGRPRIGFLSDSATVAGSTRIAFSVATPARVDAASAAARAAGARAIEGPGFHPEYGPRFYAVFFEDVDGNRYEIVAGDLLD